MNSASIGQDSGDVVPAFNASSVDLDAAADDPDMMRAITCYLTLETNEYNGQLGARVSAIFVILVTSALTTFFPVIAARSPKLKIPLYVYLFARYFGAGVIIATAFVHLLDPAYDEIGPSTCVGQTGGWADYSWVPAIVMASVFLVFIIDFAAEWYVEKKYGYHHSEDSPEEVITTGGRHASVDAAMMRYGQDGRAIRAHSHQFMHSADQDAPNSKHSAQVDTEVDSEKQTDSILQRSFDQQIAAFMVLEFGVIFHSVIIGLALGTAGDEFSVLYPVIVFHQAFEGLGVGSRLSAIPFPKGLGWMPYALCSGYAITTPLAVAIALGVRKTYSPGTYTANVVSGVLDATSAGILIYTGLVELLARDFLFNSERTNDPRQLTFMVICVLLGAGIMALLGKWA